MAAPMQALAGRNRHNQPWLVAGYSGIQQISLTFCPHLVVPARKRKYPGGLSAVLAGDACPHGGGDAVHMMDRPISAPADEMAVSMLTALDQQDIPYAAGLYARTIQRVSAGGRHRQRVP